MLRIATPSPPCFSPGETVEALAWVERGIDLDKKASRGSMAGYGLAKLKRELLTKLGAGRRRSTPLGPNLRAPEQVHLRRPHEVRAQGRAHGMACEGHRGGQRS